MKKIIFILFSLFIIVLSACQQKIVEEDDDKQPPIVEENEVELLTDRFFETGFNLLGISPVEDGRDIKKWLNYDGKAKPQSDSPWVMAQWWTPYNVVDAEYKEEDGTYIYETESRTIKVNPSDNGYLHFDLQASKEYLNGPRVQGEPWTHLLIEQDFNTAVKMSELEALYVSLELTVHHVENKTGSAYDTGLHAAQFLWYLTLRNVVPQDSKFEEVGSPGDFIWFGVPIYDNRSDYIPQSAHIDQGSPGTTGKLIYSMASNNYFNEPIQMNKTYTIRVDILPFVKEAFVYAINHNLMVNTRFENIEIGYMNFGWEIPGSFDVSSTIRNMSIKAVLK